MFFWKKKFMSPSLREDVTEGKKVHGIFSPGSGIWPCNHCNQASMPGHAEPYPSNPPLLIQSTAVKLFRMSHPQIPTFSMSLQDLLVPASLALKRKIFLQSSLKCVWSSWCLNLFLPRALNLNWDLLLLFIVNTSSWKEQNSKCQTFDCAQRNWGWDKVQCGTVSIAVSHVGHSNGFVLSWFPIKVDLGNLAWVRGQLWKNGTRKLISREPDYPENSSHISIWHLIQRWAGKLNEYFSRELHTILISGPQSSYPSWEYDTRLTHILSGKPWGIFKAEFCLFYNAWSDSAATGLLSSARRCNPSWSNGARWCWW